MIVIFTYTDFVLRTFNHWQRDLKLNTIWLWKGIHFISRDATFQMNHVVYLESVSCFATTPTPPLPPRTPQSVHVKGYLFSLNFWQEISYSRGKIIKTK